MNNQHFLSSSDISAIIEAGGTPWSLISKESGKLLGTVRTRTIAREIAPSLNAKVEKYEAPKAEEKKPRAKLNKITDPKEGPQEDTPLEDVGHGDKKSEDEKQMDQLPVPGFVDPNSHTKCPQCGSHEIYTGRVEMVKDKKTGEMKATGLVIDEGLVGGCHACDWEWNLIDVNRKKSEIKNPTKEVWEIADRMLLESRKDVVKACIAAGIANGTARTQYQYWYQINKARKIKAIEDYNKEVAARQAEAKKSK